jgi:hypothetical protein
MSGWMRGWYMLATTVFFFFLRPRDLVAVSVTSSRLFVFAYVSALSYVVASRGTHTYIFLFYCPRSLAVTVAPVRFICTIPNVTLPGYFIRRSTRGGFNGPYSPYSRYPRDCWPLPIPLQRRPRVVIPLQGSRHRHASSLSSYVYYNFKTSLTRQLHSNHYPYSEPAIRKVILYCLAHHYLYGVV